MADSKFRAAERSSSLMVSTLWESFAFQPSSGKKTILPFLVVVQLIQRMPQADISNTTTVRLFFFPLLAFGTIDGTVNFCTLAAWSLKLTLPKLEPRHEQAYLRILRGWSHKPHPSLHPSAGHWGLHLHSRISHSFRDYISCQRPRCGHYGHYLVLVWWII